MGLFLVCFPLLCLTLAANDYILSMTPRSKKNPGLWCLEVCFASARVCFSILFQQQELRLCPENRCSIFTSEFLSSALSGLNVICPPSCWHRGLDQQGKRCGEGGGGRRSLLRSLESGTCEKKTSKIAFPSFLTCALLLSFACPAQEAVLGKCMRWRTGDCEPCRLE